MRAPRVLSSIFKGGTGKTTTARVLAQAIAGDPKLCGGKPVLMIDLDPQGNTSRRFQLLEPREDGMSVPIPHPVLVKENEANNGGMSEDELRSSVCDVWRGMLGEGEEWAPEPYPTSNPMIHVAPANEPQLLKMMTTPEDKHILIGQKLRAWLCSEEVQSTYSYIIIDTAPGKSALNEAALYAASHCYIPFIPEPQAMEGAISMFSYIFKAQGRRPADDPLELLGFLPNMVMRTRLHRELLKDFENMPMLGKQLMPVMLRRRTAYAETDLAASNPDQVTGNSVNATSIEATRFAKYIVNKIDGNDTDKRGSK